MKKLLLLSSLIGFSATIIAQTVPCANMETWVNNNETGSTFLVPQKWITFDQVQNAFDPAYVGTSVIRSTSSHAGTYASLMRTAINNGDTMGGVMVAHDSVSTFFNALFGGSNSLGFPYATRSANLTCYYKLTLVGGDTAAISVIMTKWNTGLQKRDTLCAVDKYLFSNVAAYTLLSIPMSYSINANPDTALIVTGIFGPNGAKTHVGTLFYLDDLLFTGTAPFSVAEVAGHDPYLHLFPNPALSEVTVQIDASVGLNEARLVIYDVLGKEVKTVNRINSWEFKMDLHDLKGGVYFYSFVSDGKTVSNGKFAVE